MCDWATAPFELMMWSVALFTAVIFGGMAGYLVWSAIEEIWTKFKGGKRKCVK